MSTNKFWYYITKDYLGDIVKIKPSVPDRISEGNIPRIRVGSDIYKFIKLSIGVGDLHRIDVLENFGEKDLLDRENANTTSIANYNYIIRNPLVYITRETPYIPPGMLVFRQNDEHWFIKETEFRFAGYLSIKDFINCYVDKSDSQEDYIQAKDIDIFYNLTSNWYRSQIKFDFTDRFKTKIWYYSYNPYSHIVTEDDFKLEVDNQEDYSDRGTIKYLFENGKPTDKVLRVNFKIDNIDDFDITDSKDREKIVFIAKDRYEKLIR